MPPNDVITPPEVIRVETTLPNQDQIVRRSNAMLAELQAFEIDSADTLQDAVEQRNRAADKWAELEKTRKYLKEPHLEGCRRIDAMFALFQKPLIDGKTIIQSKIIDYNAEQKRAQEKRELEARAEQVRQAAVIWAAAAREEAEARAKAEALRRQGQAARDAEAKALAEGNAKAAAAASAKAAQLASKAESVDDAAAEKVAALQIEAEQTAAAPVVVEAAPGMSGLGTNWKWKATVTDALAFLTHIVNQRPDLIPLVQFDMTALNKQAGSLKDKLILPGVKVDKEPVLAKRK